MPAMPDRAIANYHVLDPNNIGDWLSAPSHYLAFPGFSVTRRDIRHLPDPDRPPGQHAIVGGGGLAFARFAENFQQLRAAPDRGKLVAWGIGQQVYGNFTTDAGRQAIAGFDYSMLAGFDLVGIRDFGLASDRGFEWVPCASCLHPAFDRPRPVKHEFAVFSHHKFQIHLPGVPRLTNACRDFERVLDFLGSAETAIVSSYHGAYWATLLGRKVLAFPFSSKIYTLKHRPAIYPVAKWRWADRSWRKTPIAQFRDRFNLNPPPRTFVCDMTGWRDRLGDARAYPESLAECRDRNRQFRDRVLDCLTSK